MDGANPFLGDIDKLETVEEYKVEVLVRKDLENTIQALKKGSSLRRACLGSL